MIYFCLTGCVAKARTSTRCSIAGSTSRAAGGGNKGYDANASRMVAGLVDTLMGNWPYTMFASTDEAFKKLPAGTVENSLKPETS